MKSRPGPASTPLIHLLFLVAVPPVAAAQPAAPEDFPPEIQPPPPPGPEPLPFRARRDPPWFPPAPTPPPPGQEPRPGPDDPPGEIPFGRRGQVALDAGLLVSFAHTALTQEGYEDGSRTTFAFNPGAAVFVGSGVFLRGQLNYRYSSVNRKESLSTLGVGGGLGANSPAGNRFSVMPSAALIYAWERENTATLPDRTYNRLLLTLTVKLLFHPVRHFFVGLGPTWTHSLISRLDGNDGPSSSTFSGEGIIGVWF